MRKLWSRNLALLAAGGLFVTVAPATAEAVEPPNFRIGIQLADNGGRGGFGVEQFTGFANFGTSVSQWAGDSNNFDPDGARIDLNPAFGGGRLNQIDFRIGGQARDGGRELGPVAYTPWASQGGGTTDLITDSNSFDPDQYRLFLETRPLPPGVQITDLRLSILAVDRGAPEGVPAFTRWASQGGGHSGFALDSDAFDPDGFRIGLEVV
ncbi:hypothetical protein [Amycolatopsis sp. EV170708-02-1]|uniref:hypothetical protein n=1 Tax=Amycolatopsis sp. EV170708-02-1 TaxID=2919322 RepID=UPI001F0C5B80|nr:hypothetical protein [Amycolatopsis sp. EV170708-02-1]UMP06385.1 hypothetical protein MJQ72_16910 [Amycolatopsis sp. EV170708-02-1]